MQIDESTSFDEFQGKKLKKKPDPVRQQKFRVVLITVTLIVVLAALATVLKKTNALDVIRGTGTITGSVVDDNGVPFHGDIFILGTDLSAKTDEGGQFEISGVPAGKQSLIVADEFVGHEFIVEVPNSSQLQVGQLRFQSTAIAPP